MATFDAIIAAAVRAEGTEHVFGLMGAATIRLVSELKHGQGVNYHAARHEGGAVAAADGYARAGGGVGVCAVTWGPAVTNTLTALVTAKRGSTPLVLIAGDSSSASLEQSPFARGAQGLDQALLLSALGIPVVRAHPSNAGRDVAETFDIARRSNSPAALLLPLEHLGQAASPQIREAPPTMPVALPPAADAIRAAVEALRTSERPVILAGRGAATPGARDALTRLADATGALLATSLRANGLFSGHRYNVGVAGGFAAPPAVSLFRQADCVAAFGASLNIFTTIGGKLFPNAKIVHCDADPAAFHGYTRADVAVRGDAEAVAHELLQELGPETPVTSLREAADTMELAADHLKQPFDDVSRKGALDPRAVCRRLDALLPAERTVVIDGGQASAWPPEQMTFTDPRSFLWMIDFGSLGAGLGAATGAALARPSRTTLLIVGDGALWMSLGDLELPARERIPLLIACLNDRAYQSELQHMAEWGLPLDDTAIFDAPDLEPIARAMGCDAETITELEQIDALASRARALSRPLLLDCRITQEVLHSPVRAHVV